jgi:hypothetical protein
MKELFFATDLLALFQHDKHYGVPEKLSVALRKLGLETIARSDNIEQMRHALVVHIMDHRGESEAFLADTFIYPEAVVALFKEHGLPAPAALQPESAAASSSKGSLDDARFEQLFDTVCHNCGTVRDPLAKTYRTPIGRLIFRTFVETRQSQGINTTGKYILGHLKNFDTEKIITSINDDYVTWKTEDTKEKLTSLDTIMKFTLKFNREIENAL